MTRIEELEAHLIKVKAERDEARAALEHDRSKVIQACNEFNEAFQRREWLLTTRGPYEWDDERYREEFGEAIKELEVPIAVLQKIGVDWSNCPTDHDEIMSARIEWKAHAETYRAAIPVAYQMALEDAANVLLDKHTNNVGMVHPITGADCKDIRTTPIPTDLVERAMKETGQ